MESLLNAILEELKIDLGLTEDSDIAVLTIKVKNAYREIERARSYPSSFTEDAIAEDMQNYRSNVQKLALYDYDQIGAEGQSSHSENGYTRTWRSRRECFDGVTAFCTTF